MQACAREMKKKTLQYSEYTLADSNLTVNSQCYAFSSSRL